MTRSTPSLAWYAPWFTVFLPVLGAGCSKPAAAPTPRPAAAAVDAPKPPASAAAAAPAAATPAVEPTAPDDAVATLRKALKDAPDKIVLVDVVDEIATLGQQGRPLLDELVRATGDNDLRVRWHAARAIGLIGEDALSAVPTLVKLLGDPDPVVATQAAAAIGMIREDDDRTAMPEADGRVYAAAVDPLVKATTHGDPRVRRSALRAIRRLVGSTAELAPLLSRQLADADPSVVMPALHSLADMDETAVPVLLEALADPKARYWAEVALTEIGPEAAPAIDMLAKVAGEGETVERIQALLALAAIGEKSRSVAASMVKLLDSEDNAVQFAAAFALGSVRASEGDTALEHAAAGPDPFLAAVASWARAKIHPDDTALVAEAVTRLRAQLRSDHARARAAAASGLSDLSDSLAEPIRAELAADFASALADADPNANRTAGAALIRLGGSAVESLRGKLADPAIRGRVLEVLGGLGPKAQPVLDDLTAALDDPDPTIRGEAAAAIAAIGPTAAAAVPKLLDILRSATKADADRTVILPAGYALGRIGPAAKPALDTLRALAASKDEMLATVAVWAALKIEPQDASLLEMAIPALRKAARAAQDIVRLEAVVALGDIGPAASGAIPILELTAEEDSVKDIRAAAAEALRKIKGG